MAKDDSALDSFVDTLAWTTLKANKGLAADRADDALADHVGEIEDAAKAYGSTPKDLRELVAKKLAAMARREVQ